MDFENPIKAFIKHRMEEQETKAQMTKPANKAVIFTDADQRKKLNMNSVQSSFNFNAVDDETYFLDKLYDLLAAGQQKTKLIPNLLPEVITTGENAAYLPSHRYVRLDALRARFEWFITISKSNNGTFSIVNDYKGSYVELEPNYYLLQLSANSLNNSFIEIANVYDLSSNQYNRMAIKANINDEIKQIANNLENTDRWKIPTPQADEIYYVPKGVRRDAEDGLWITIDRFIAEIRDSEKLKLPTSDITSSY